MPDLRIPARCALLYAHAKPANLRNSLLRGCRTDNLKLTLCRLRLEVCPRPRVFLATVDYRRVSGDDKPSSTSDCTAIRRGFCSGYGAGSMTEIAVEAMGSQYVGLT